MSTRIRHQSIEIADLLGARVDRSGDRSHFDDAVGNSERDVVATHESGHGASAASQRSRSGGAMVAVRPEEIEVVVPEEWLADLHDPSLVIAPSYIGPDRRRAVRTTAPQQDGLPLWFRRVCLVAFLTALCVVPLTMIASRSVPPASTPAPTPQATAADAATARQQARVAAQIARAQARSQARAQAADQVAQARAAAPVAARAVPSSPQATTVPDVSSSATSSLAGSDASQTRAAARAQAAQQRADLAQARATQAQVRADARVAAAQARVTARAAASASAAASAGTSSGSSSGSSPVNGSTSTPVVGVTAGSDGAGGVMVASSPKA